MSSPIMPIGSSADPPSSTAPAIRQEGDAAAFVSELAAGGRALEIDAARVSPPPEVLDQVARAAAVHERLRSEGVELRFSLRGQGAAPRVEMIDGGGSSRELSLTDAFAMAAGADRE